MAHAEPPKIDPRLREAERARRVAIGMGMLTAGVFGVLFGLGGAVSVFLDNDPQPNLAGPAAGLALAGGGGLLMAIGWRKLPPVEPAKAPGNPAPGGPPRVPPAPGPAPGPSARGAREGRAGATPGSGGRHACGARNEPGDLFCKGCGLPLAERSCPACRARNDVDARFCRRCGTALTILD